MALYLSESACTCDNEKVEREGRLGISCNALEHINIFMFAILVQLTLYSRIVFGGRLSTRFNVSRILRVVD